MFDVEEGWLSGGVGGRWRGWRMKDAKKKKKRRIGGEGARAMFVE